MLARAIHQHGTNIAVRLDKFDLLVSRLAQFGRLVPENELIRRLKDSITKDTYKAVKMLINQHNLPGQQPFSYWEQRNMFLQQCYEEYPQFNEHGRTSLRQLSSATSNGDKDGQNWRCPIHQTNAHKFRECKTYKQMQARLNKAERGGKQQQQRRNKSGDKGLNSYVAHGKKTGADKTQDEEKHHQDSNATQQPKTRARAQ